MRTVEKRREPEGRDPYWIAGRDKSEERVRSSLRWPDFVYQPIMDLESRQLQR